MGRLCVCVYTCVRVCECTRVCMYVCVSVMFVYMFMCECTYTGRCMCESVWKHVCIYVYMCMFVMRFILSSGVNTTKRKHEIHLDMLD